MYGRNSYNFVPIPCSRRTWDWNEILRIPSLHILGYTRRASAAQLRINIHTRTRSRVISIAHPVLTVPYVWRVTHEYINEGLKLKDRFTRTRIPARYSRYRHTHPGLTCSRKRTLFASTVLAAVITVTAKYLSFVGSTILCMVDKAGRPRANMRPWPRPLALERSRRKPAGHGPRPPLFDFSVYRLAIGREGINPWAE